MTTDHPPTVIDHDPGHQRETAEVVAHYVPPAQREREKADLRELRMRRWFEPWLYAGLFMMALALLAMFIIVIKGGLA